MGFLDKLFSKKEEKINTNADFWKWFQQNEKEFFKITQAGDNVQSFHNKLSDKLNELREGYYFLSGMLTDDTAELVITADGNIKNFVFVEELVADAPQINGWKFTALKPDLDIQAYGINMDGYSFSDKTISFYSNENKIRPDEIDITVLNSDFTEENKDTIILGTHIFLDNFLGEINFATTIDNISVIGTKDTQKELIPIEKLKAYLIWREKEFVEKYEGIRHNTDNDTYILYEYKHDDYPIIGVINTDLLQWEAKAAYPWILKISIAYDGLANNGMPNQMVSALVDSSEEKFTEQLKEKNNTLNLGRETGCNTRDIFFACKEFRKSSLIVDSLINQQTRFKIDYMIYKDKYWQTFEKFKQ
ncbi:DUF695 domain-containing protein [Flavobacterium sp. DG1-102-2]|uniref:DUF695 domain-containing protein n=1 Tax=Flavobacterium sp. DG1-102-2 TaxID=3081663 RepID=UPI002948FB7C|nr:DUF695 domain-containing protein [Flavobacterium sp. DG1-102-2]MDV6170080.1 DUF695 domain-containing protein [Flavobacterium sp. DG1-102-2]